MLSAFGKRTTETRLRVSAYSAYRKRLAQEHAVVRRAGKKPSLFIRQTIRFLGF